MPPRMAPAGLTRNDFLGLACCCLAFFCLSLVGGRPLTMHEGVLPQSAREMARDHDWVVPKNGGRPWLESPPLPQWCTVGLYTLFGRSDQLWVARIGPAVMGTISVLLLAWMAGRWLGRTQGILSGLVFATMYELVQYAWLAEDEIYLCALVTTAVAAFVHCEFVRGDSAAEGSRHFFGSRPLSLWLFYVALGFTNLAKGLLFGTAMACVSIGVFLLLSCDWRRIAFYCWSWGWLTMAAIALAWPFAAWLRYPDVTDVWFFDHVGRLDGDYVAITKPVWYYLKTLPGEIAPWTPLALVGLWLTREKAVKERLSPERFVWCWAIATPLVFSIPSGKNHHYLLHCIAPWAVLTSVALTWIRDRLMERTDHRPLVAAIIAGMIPLVVLPLVKQKLAGPDWLFPALMCGAPMFAGIATWAILQVQRPQLAAGALFGTVAACYCGAHLYAGAYVDLCRDDTLFLTHVREFVGTDKPVFVDTKLASLDEFRILFYLDDRAKALHNVSFLADERIHHDEVYVVARASTAADLKAFGDVEIVDQSRHTRRERTAADRFTLFRLTYAADRPRVTAKNVRISPMQVMQRQEGPWLK